jgi:uncharacterized ion transporter superfamily protein YfcC
MSGSERVEPADPSIEQAVERRPFPSAFTVLGIVTVFIWVLAFFIPAGQYEKDAHGGPIAGTYQRIDAPQDFEERVRDLFIAPVNGLYGIQAPETGEVGPFNAGALYGAAGVFLFVLAIGAFMTVVFATGALDLGIGHLTHRLRARGGLLIAVIMALFALLGTAMGWAEETLGFYGLIVPLTLALGYDRMVAVAIVFVSAGVGLMGSTVNPFAIGVASGEAGISIGDGIGLRFLLWVVLTSIAIAYVLRYASRVRADPAYSLVGIDPADRELVAQADGAAPEPLTARHKAILALVACAFSLMIFSVIPWAAVMGNTRVDPYTHDSITNPYWFELGWWFPELTALFIMGAIVVGVVGRLGEPGISGAIAKGAGDFLGPALTIVLARGVSVIMNNTKTIDTVLNAMEGAVSGTSAAVFTTLIMVVNVPLAFLIPSSSGHATLAMPILAPLGDFAGVDRSLVVTSWNAGSRWIGMILPTSGVLIGGLALAKVGYDKYLRFMLPLLAILFVVAALIIGSAATFS